MKFEKLNENKIRITLSSQDLAEKNIDFHSFMSNSQESQHLFLDMLDEAEKKVGFITKNYKIRIEALAMSDGDFILTITRFNKALVSEPKSIHNKQSNTKNTILNQIIYKFDCFDDFCYFCNYAIQLKLLSHLAQNIVLYYYKNTYYICISRINSESINLNNLCSIISEFGSYIDNSDLFIKKLNEYGKIVFKHNAIKTCAKFFNILA